MQYRKLGKIDFETSILGFGCMRFPTTDGIPPSKNIDEDEAVKMLRYSIDNGVNYIDTAYPYHQGRSELVVGKALKEGYRNKVKIASKSPTFLINEEGDFERFLDEQLNRLGTDNIDFYLLHTLDRHKWENVVLKFDLLSKCEKAIKSGKINHLGFSFHDEQDMFFEIIDGYDKWEFCQIQLNYLNEEYQAGLKGMKYAAEKGLGIIVMEPLFGGKLSNPSNKITNIFDESDIKRTPTEWALDYIWNMPEVSLLLSGMSNMEQVRQNIEYAEKGKPNMFSQKETEIIEKVKKRFSEIGGVPCTKCSYCMPCPRGVDIPRNFELYNALYMYDALEIIKADYEFTKQDKNGIRVASNCIQCGECEAKCPQHIKISSIMEDIVKKFE